MSDADQELQYKQEFTARVKAARMATGLKQWQIAEVLGIPQDHYKHWEKTRLMPHHLIERFCLICHINPEWLMTGKGEKPLRAPQIVAGGKGTAPKPRKSRRSRAA